MKRDYKVHANCSEWDRLEEPKDPRPPLEKAIDRINEDQDKRRDME